MLDNRTITMPSKASSQNAGSTLSRRPPRGSKSKGKIVNSIHPPHSDVPFEFIRNEDDRSIVRSQQRDEMWKRTSKEEELVKYMSKVPSYLQRGEKLEDYNNNSNNNNSNVFSFGVLDWRRLEQWTQKREKVLVNEKFTRLSNGSCSSSFSEQSNMSNFSNLGPQIDSSNCDGELPKCPQVFDDYCSSKPEGEGIIVLLPKDYSGSGSSKAHHRGSLDGKGGGYNWGSFSDIPHSCPLNFGVDLEKELDLKLDTLVKSQGVEIPLNFSDMPLHNVESKFEVESNSLTISKESMNRNSHRFSNEIVGDSSIHRRISSSLARMTRSLSFRESLGQPRSKSGPAKPDDCSTNSEPQNNNKASVSGRVKVSPLRRLLDPIRKSKIVDQMGERSNSNDLILKRFPTPMNEKHEPSIIKAVLHLTVKNALPLLKFVVGSNDEIFASSVTSLRTLRKNEDDMSLLYTFYSVQKIRKHSNNNSWKKSNQKVKPCELGYNIVGQMKVSNETNMVKEYVLYNVEVGNENGGGSEFKTSREMAAIVVDMGDVSRGKNVNDWFCDDLEENKVGHIVVILPGGDHGLPHDGMPSSLISRWRNGGLCDCGGWDIGCKLRVLREQWEEQKYLQVQCDLYEQGEAKQHSPIFSLIPLQDGLFSVEYNSEISSLQAFSISVSLISTHINTPSYPTNSSPQTEWKQELGSGKASMAEGREKHARHPPLSPVGRV